MCGIAGFILAPNSRLDNPAHVLAAMTDAIRHRGPDDEGGWHDNEAGVALGHRRLSILDLSEAGHQPMASASGRYVTVFNGEIYNHLDIRNEIEQRGARNWRGHSDTETLLAAADIWGIEATFQRCTGMFAAAIWDRRERTLSLVRDRMGEKPLYYGWANGAFLFASELKALRNFPGFNPAIDRDALGLYMAFACVPAPRSIYRDVFKLMPGTILTLPAQNCGTSQSARTAAYWSLGATMQQQPRFQGSPAEAAEELERLLERAVRMQQISDVPLGCFLSGGIDSSVITALMQKQSHQPIKTFAIGFEEAAFNEAHHAAAVAQHLGTSHTELILTARDALNIVPCVPEIWDEPFADSSQLPTACVAMLARSKVTVCLSGDGGDELFGGYPRYEVAQNVERLPAKGVLRALLSGPGLGAVDAALKLLPGTGNLSRHRLERLGHVLKAGSREQRYLSWLSHVRDPADIVRDTAIRPGDVSDFRAPSGTDVITALSALDAVTYLPNDILAKVDRAAMAVGLETRVPLLDHNVVEFAYSLPATHKIRDGVAKWPLRQILNRHVPRSLTDRPKKGFSVPIRAWLRGPLKEWAGDLLSPASLQRSGLEAAAVARLWQNLHSDTPAPDLQPRIWAVLMYQAWFARYH